MPSQPLDVQVVTLLEGEDPYGLEADVLLLGGTSGDPGYRDRVAAELSVALGVDAARLLARREASSEAGAFTSVDLDLPDRQALVWLGLGNGSPADLRSAGAAAARGVSRPALCLLTRGLGADQFGAFTEGLLLGGYSFSLKSSAKPDDRRFILLASDAAQVEAYERAGQLADGVALARDLANTPSSVKSPEWFADRCVDVAEDARLRCRITNSAHLSRQGFGGILAVGGGSVRPPLLVQMGLSGPAKAPHVVLVGKGITYDSGGLSLKPVDSMAMMKTDMAGAAAVVGAMSIAGRRRPKVRVTALLPVAENMPSGTAYRPGDVVMQYGGATTEIVNTDAEGRIVLADALAFAVARLRPDIIVDIATLTGAATFGLSRNFGALYANDEQLAEELTQAGADSGDRLWRMPLEREYRAALDSPVADIRQSATGAIPGGGSIVAALFLQHFIGDTPWAHLDIAGPGRSEADRLEISAGATGFGVRVLTRWLDTFGDRR